MGFGVVAGKIYFDFPLFGEIKVTSTPEQGSVFWFDLILPVVEKSGDETLNISAQSRLPVATTGEPKKILIVDDNQNSRLVLTSLFASLNFTVWEAHSGEIIHW